MRNGGNRSPLRTVLGRPGGRTVVIGPEEPVVIIGEKINPTGKKQFAEELRRGDLSSVRRWAQEQAVAGAGVIDINVGTHGVNEVELLPAAVQAVMECTDLPLSLDSGNAKAMEAALAICDGKVILNSTTGERQALETILPLAMRHGAAVIGLCYDEEGISSDPRRRLQVAEKILNRAVGFGISPADVILDPLALPVSTNTRAAAVTLETARLIREHFGTNLTLGVSNTSFGLPDRAALNLSMLIMAIAMGVNCPIADPTRPEVIKAVLACDLLAGRDEMAARWLHHFRSGAGRQTDSQQWQNGD